MAGQAFAFQAVPFLFEHHSGGELIRADFIEAEAEAQLQRGAEIQRSPEEQAGFRGLGGIEFVERAVIAAPAIVGSVGAQPRIAEFLAAERPMNKEPQGGLLRPLPGRQFGPPVSWNAASRASIAAFTATA
jgi:hypothetical protein